MKQLIFKLIIPLTVISFGTITKWWYALPEDAPDTLFNGFPFPFVCEGWHTSMSLQIFLTELTIDFLTYFIFWFTIVFFIKRFLTKINPHKIITIALWTFTGFIISVGVLFASNTENLFYVRRPFSIEIMETGYKFVWQQIERPDYYKYHPESKQK